MCTTPLAHPGRWHNPKYFCGSGSRKDMILVSSAEPQEGCKTSEKNEYVVGCHHKCLSRPAKFSLPQWDMETCFLMPKRALEKWRGLLDLKESCKQDEGWFSRHQCGRMTWGPYSSLPPLPPPAYLGTS